MNDLCKLCLTFHTELHEEQANEALVEKMEDILGVTRDKLANMIYRYEKEIKKLESVGHQRSQEWEVMINKIRDKIQKNKKIVDNVVEAYFKELENQLMQKYIYPAKKMALDSVFLPVNKLKFKIDKLELLRNNLEKERNENQIIKYVFTKDDGGKFDQLEKKINRIIKNNVKMIPHIDKIGIDFNQDKLNEVY